MLGKFRDQSTLLIDNAAMKEIKANPSQFMNGGYVRRCDSEKLYESIFVYEGSYLTETFGTRRAADRWVALEKRLFTEDAGLERVDEGFLSRFFHNQKVKLLFGSTYIKGWKDCWKWEKTPQCPKNVTVALQALDQLSTYYQWIGSQTLEQIQASNKGFSRWFSGFKRRIVQWILGNPKKLESLVSFNQSMKSAVPNLYHSLAGFISGLDELANRGKSLDSVETNGDMITQMMERSINPNIGGNIDIRL